MERKDLIETLKENNHVAYEKTTEEDIRLAVIFRPYGFFCGYIGVPKENSVYDMDEEEVESIFSPLCNCGVTYDSNDTPTDLKKDKERRWIGFDCGHTYNGNDIELVREIYGEREATVASLVKGMGSFVPYDEVLAQVYDMVLAANHYASKTEDIEDTVEAIIKDATINILERLLKEESLFTEKGKRVVTALVKEIKTENDLLR